MTDVHGMPRIATLVLAAVLASGPPLPAQPVKVVDPRALYEAGRALLASGDAYRAADAFMEALAINPAYADAWGALAQCQYDLGEYGRAINHISEAYKFGPRTPSLLTLEGFSAIGLGRLDDARTLFEEALSRLPNDRDARFGLALLDLRGGRPVDARARLAASLKSAPSDPRALLSLALIAGAEGLKDEEAAYLGEALRWMSGDADAYSAAAAMFAERGDAAEASRLARNAIDVQPAHAAARGLLASLYHDTGAYGEARTVLEGSLKYDRTDPQAWFLLGLVEAAAGRHAGAEYALGTLVDLRPDDEFARIALENLVMDATRFEDPSRARLASWRFGRAADFERRLLYVKAIAEYRRGLAIDPYANVGRKRYAELLRLSKLPVSYLAELRFLESLGKADKALSDAIETYDRMLQGSLGRDWKVDGIAVPSRPYRIAVFSTGPGGTPYHAGSDMVIARYLRDTLAFEPGITAERGAPRIPGYADAYRLAREGGADWFLLVSVAESDRDILLGAELRSARTGALAIRIEAPRTGNDRVALAVDRVIQGVRDFLPARGVLVERKADLALVDLGRVDGVAVDDAFLVLRNGSALIKADASGIGWAESDVVARLVAKRVDDEFFEGRLERVGFFDRVNPRDIVVREPPKPEPAPAKPGAKPTAKPAAAPAVPAASSRVWSVLFDRVKSLY
jgi:tetratricopeptide (TPR) repeat protein